MLTTVTLGVLCAALIVALVLTVRFFLAELRENEDAMSLERISWVEERRELLNRVQRPEYVPTGPVASFEVPEPEPDDIEQVGTISYLPDVAA